MFASKPGVVIISPILNSLNKTFKAGVIICKQASMEAIMMFGNVHVFNFYLLILSIYLFAYGATTFNDQNNKN